MDGQKGPDGCHNLGDEIATLARPGSEIDSCGPSLAPEMLDVTLIGDAPVGRSVRLPRAAGW